MNDFLRQLEKYLYGIGSVGIVFVVMAVIGMMISRGSMEAVVVYSLIVIINSFVVGMSMMLIRWINRRENNDSKSKRV